MYRVADTPRMRELIQPAFVDGGENVAVPESCGVDCATVVGDWHCGLVSPSGYWRIVVSARGGGRGYFTYYLFEYRHKSDIGLPSEMTCMLTTSTLQCFRGEMVVAYS